MNRSNQVIFMADDDADDRYFMHKALEQIQPSVTFVENREWERFTGQVSIMESATNTQARAFDSYRYEYA